MLVAVAQSALAAVNPAAAMVKSTRVDRIRASMPDSGIMMTSAIRYAVCTQAISSDPALSPAWMSLSELDTTWMSRMAMNMPTTMKKHPTIRLTGIATSLGLVTATPSNDKTALDTTTARKRV